MQAQRPASTAIALDAHRLQRRGARRRSRHNTRQTLLVLRTAYEHVAAGSASAFARIRARRTNALTLLLRTRNESRAGSSLGASFPRAAEVAPAASKNRA